MLHFLTYEIYYISLKHPKLHYNIGWAKIKINFTQTNVITP